MLIRPDTWKTFITHHTSAEETNKSFPYIFEAFDKEKSIFECTNAALGMSPGIFLAFPIDSQRPILIHHLQRAFRNPAIRGDMDEFFGMISWDDRPLATKLDPLNLFVLAGDGNIDIEGNIKDHFNDIDTTRLFAARDAREFGNVPDSDQEGKMFLRRCIPIPPFLALKIIDHIEEESAHDLGARMATFIREINQDTNNEFHDIVTSEEGKLALKTILAWLLKVQTCFDLRIASSQVYAGSKIDKLAKAIKFENLMDTNLVRQNTIQSDPTKDFIIQSNVAVMQELLESRRQLQEKTNPSNDKGFQKLSAATQAFLLAVGTHDFVHQVESIASSGLELLKMTQKHAIDELARRIKKDRQEEVNLDTAHAIEIISIKWFASHNPFIGLSLCRMPPTSKHSAASAFEKAEKLELQKELEFEKSEIISTLTDRTLYRPITIEDLLCNVNIMQGIIELYIGAECMLAQRLAEFYQEIRRTKSSIKLLLASDDTILTKIQFVFDSRLNTWLDRMYEFADNLDEVDHNLINFAAIIQSIQYGNFATELPLNLLPSAPTKKRPASGNNDIKEKEKQKQKKGDINDNIIPEFKLREDETWSKFTKDPNNIRPASVCMMFHILGHCPQGKNCKRAKSHESLTEAQRKQVAAFIEDRRK